MNFEQVISILRQALLFGGGILVSKGWADNETMVQIAGAISALIAGVWAIYTRRNTGLIASAASLDSVKEIKTTSTTAAITVDKATKVP